MVGPVRIEPDVVVEYDAEDLAEGGGTVLEAAVEELRDSATRTPRSERDAARRARCCNRSALVPGLLRWMSRRGTPRRRRYASY